MAKKAAKKAGDAADPQRAGIIEQLTTLGISFDASQTTQNLQIILSNHPNPGQQQPLVPAVPADTSSEFEVGDPEELRPRTLPLVIKPKAGSDWKNESQAEFARILNGYAYQNPKKWNKKKAALLSTLKELGDLPEDEAAEKLLVMKGGDINVKIGSQKLKDANIE